MSSGPEQENATKPNAVNHKRNSHPLTIERRNLMAVGKLVIKELIDMALKCGRNISESNPTLMRFLIILERIICHGLKGKRGLFGDRIVDPWVVIEMLPRVRPESSDVIKSVQQISDLKTGLAKARVWLRMALMQKNLGDCFRILVEKKERLKLEEYYVPLAFMMEEEGQIFAGLMLGLNVIDCNFSIRDSLNSLEEPIGIADYARYLKKDFEEESCPVTRSEDDEEFSMILDQKNYLEELNQRLTSQTDSLEKKCKFAFDTLMKTKEELAELKERSNILQEENDVLRAEKESLELAMERQKQSTESDLQVERETYQQSRQGLDTMCVDLQNKLRNETQMRLDVETELQKQIAMRTEAECALQLLENHVHQKQDTIISLRGQIEEVKALNLEQYDKLQRTQRNVTDSTSTVKVLEDQLSEAQVETSELRAKIASLIDEKTAAEETARKLGQQLAVSESRRSELETDLRLERERRVSAVRENETTKQKFANLNREIERLKLLEKKLQLSMEEKAEVERRCAEQEEALAEMAAHLSESKLETDTLRETQVAQQEAQWTSDKTVKNCKQCNRVFSVTLRRHHCRNCGDIYCGDCSDNKMLLPSSAKPVRVCDACNTLLLQRYTARVGTEGSF